MKQLTPLGDQPRPTGSPHSLCLDSCTRVAAQLPPRAAPVDRRGTIQAATRFGLLDPRPAYLWPSHFAGPPALRVVRLAMCRATKRPTATCTVPFERDPAVQTPMFLRFTPCQGPPLLHSSVLGTRSASHLPPSFAGDRYIGLAVDTGLDERCLRLRPARLRPTLLRRASHFSITLNLVDGASLRPGATVTLAEDFGPAAHTQVF